MEGHCSTRQSPQWAVVPVEEEEEELFSKMQFTTQATVQILLAHFYKKWIRNVRFHK